MSSEELEKSKKRTEELVKESEKDRKVLWLEAKAEYDKKYKDEITMNDIDRLVDGEKPFNEQTKKLQEINI